MLPRSASFALLAIIALAAQSASAQNGRDCGEAGQACCCPAIGWRNPRCCATGKQCTMFSGAGFGSPLPEVQSLCLENPSPACGTEGSPCCIAPNNNGFVEGTCKDGLTCIPGTTAFGSKAMFDKFTGGYQAAMRDTTVTGTCRKATTCNTAYNPCGKAAGCGSAACPSGFYCAATFDSGVGDVCLPLPANAGKAGGPCLPSNYPGSPVIQSAVVGAKVAAPYCSGSAICFTPTGGDVTGFTFNKPDEAKDLATRISGTTCVEVPADCGTLGKQCCPSTYNMITDKPVPAAAWGGDACDPKGAKHGTFCQGSYSVLGGQPLGKCEANIACGGPKQPCCKYSKVDMAGVNCPNLGRPGAGFCALNNKCMLCPKVLYTVEELIRCY